MKNKAIQISVIILLLIVSSCGDFIDAKLDKDEMYLVAPGDSMMTCNQEIQFIWDENLDAEGYTFQIARPSFGNMEEIIVDSLVEGTRITQMLDIGKYSWRIKATNSTSETNYKIRTFEILKNISAECVAITSPKDSLQTESEEIIFMWDKLEGATSYNIQIVQPSFAEAEKVLVDTTIVNNRFSHELAIGKYQWRIKALNAKTESKSIVRTLERK